jgi:UDP-N-acetylenolpyruvoylglucosamine reductase
LPDQKLGIAVVSLKTNNRFRKNTQQFPDEIMISLKPSKSPTGWLIEQAGFKGKRFGMNP